MSSVYALGDPRTNQIRYIGIAQDVYKRYAQHLNSPQTNDAKNIWIEEMKSAGILPTLTILEADVNEVSIFERERYWIRYYLAQGAPLTNIVGVSPAGRPRSAAIRQSILDTARSLVKSEGFSALTIERIAREAGVGKPTIYRWWSSKAVIVFEALLQYAEQAVPVPIEGSLPVRLIALLRAIFKVLNDEIGAIVSGSMAEAQDDPTFADHFRVQFINVWRELLLSHLNDGVASGQLVASTNIDVLADLIYGAMWYRLLAQHAPLDDAFAYDIVQTLLHIPALNEDMPR